MKTDYNLMKKKKKQIGSSCVGFHSRYIFSTKRRATYVKLRRQTLIIFSSRKLSVQKVTGSCGPSIYYTHRGMKFVTLILGIFHRYAKL